MSVRVVGVGNLRRGDDAAGLLAVRLLRRVDGREDVSHVLSDGDAGRLLDLLDGARTVLVVDAVATGAPAGTIVRLDARAAPLPASLRATTSTHGFGLAEAIELGRALGRLPERLVVWGVEGTRFDAGAPLSPAVRSAIPELVTRLRAELGVSDRRGAPAPEAAPGERVRPARAR